MNDLHIHNYRLRQMELLQEASVYRSGSRQRLPLPRLVREALNRMRGGAIPVAA
jgi:hypothetical protein